MNIMANYEEIKRKHFRFPAYSDETGVKIESTRKFPAFSEEDNWILTEENDSVFKSKESQREDRTLRRSPRVSHEKAGQSIQQREELEQHRKNLPDYGKHYQPEISPTGKKKLFGEAIPQSTFKVKEKRAEASTPRASVNKGEFTRSYFVPKYIPASMIPDELPKEEIDRNELVTSMSKDNYLLFDTEPAAYQERKDSDPTVSKFNHPKEVKMTRSQYRENAKKDKKRSVLDRSLDGMIEEGVYESDTNGYFKK